MFKSSYKLRALKEDRYYVNSAKSTMRNISSDASYLNNRISNAADSLEDVFKCNSTYRISSDIERLNSDLRSKINSMINEANSLSYQIDKLIDNEEWRLSQEEDE